MDICRCRVIDSTHSVALLYMYIKCKEKKMKEILLKMKNNKNERK